MTEDLGSWRDILSPAEHSLYNTPETTPRITLEQFDSLEKLESTPDESFKIPMLDHAIVSAVGKDNERFLNSQFTCDFTKIENNCHVLTSWCNPKGRVKYLITVIKVEDVFYLLIDKALVNKFLSQIKIYVLNSDVKFDDVSNFKLAFQHSQSFKDSLKWYLGESNEIKKKLVRSFRYSDFRIKSKPPQNKKMSSSPYY